MYELRKAAEMTKKIRVLLVDDHSVVRIGFQALLDQSSEVAVVAQAASGREAYEQYVEILPDVVVLDLVMPSGYEHAEDGQQAKVNGGLEAIRRIRVYDDAAKILVLTSKEGGSILQQVFQAGARGFVTKHCVGDELLKAIEEVYYGRIYGDPPPVETDDPLQSLTKREFQIFSLLAEGQKAASIADSMHLSPKTIHAHRSKILRKLQVSNNSELVHMAIRAGIVEA